MEVATARCKAEVIGPIVCGLVVDFSFLGCSFPMILLGEPTFDSLP